MSREALGHVRQNLSLAPHVRDALRAQAAAAGLDVSAYVTMLVMRESAEQAAFARRVTEGVPPHLAAALEHGKRGP